MLRKLVSALNWSGEPSGKAGSSLVILAARSQSSIRVRRISSLIVRTRNFLLHRFPAAPIAAFGGGPCAGGGGLHRL
jgi:hypothetical protein